MGKELQKIETFQKDLALAETLEEIKWIDNAAAAYQEFTRRENLGLEIQNNVGEFRVDVECKPGQWLDDNYPHGGREGNTNASENEGSTDRPPFSMPTNKTESARARGLRKAKKKGKIKEVIETIKARGDVVTPHKVYVGVKKKEKRTAYVVEIPEGKYSVIYTDPPWPVGSIDMGKWESPLDDKYPTMTIDEIKRLSVEHNAADDCGLFMWTTHFKTINQNG